MEPVVPMPRMSHAGTEGLILALILSEGCQYGHIAGIADVGFLNRICTERGYGDGDILQALGAFGCSYDHFFQHRVWARAPRAIAAKARADASGFILGHCILLLIYYLDNDIIYAIM